MHKSVIGSICIYLMSCDAGLRKHLSFCPKEYFSQTWNGLKKYLSIHRINGAIVILQLSQNMGLILISVLTPNVHAIASKITSGMAQMQKSVIGSICAYSISCDAGFSKASKVLPQWMCTRNMKSIKKYFLIYCINSAFLMNVAKRSLKIVFCDYKKKRD